MLSPDLPCMSSDGDKAMTLGFGTFCNHACGKRACVFYVTCYSRGYQSRVEANTVDGCKSQIEKRQARHSALTAVLSHHHPPGMNLVAFNPQAVSKLYFRRLERGSLWGSYVLCNCAFTLASCAFPQLCFLGIYSYPGTPTHTHVAINAYMQCTRAQGTHTLMHTHSYMHAYI